MPLPMRAVVISLFALISYLSPYSAKAECDESGWAPNDSDIYLGDRNSRERRGSRNPADDYVAAMEANDKARARDAARSRAWLEVGTVVKHHGVGLIVATHKSGQNFWIWREVRKNGTLGSERSGYDNGSSFDFRTAPNYVLTLELEGGSPSFSSDVISYPGGLGIGKVYQLGNQVVLVANRTEHNVRWPARRGDDFAVSVRPIAADGVVSNHFQALRKQDVPQSEIREILNSVFRVRKVR